MRINLSRSHISWRTTYSNQVKGKTTYSNQVKGKKRWHHLLHADVISWKSLKIVKIEEENRIFWTTGGNQ